jgi:hypothetical protein
MAGEIAYKLTAEEKQALEAIKRIAEAFAGGEGAVKKMTDATKQLSKDQEEMGRAAQRVMREIETPQERYNAKLAELNKLLEAGKLTQDQFGRAAKQAGDELEGVGKKGTEAFGAKAVGDLKSYITGMVSLHAAIDLAKRGLEALHAAQQEAANRARESEFSFGSLAEVSGGSTKRFAHNLELARHIAATAGMKENEAAALTFALLSAGAEGEADVFAGAKKAGVISEPAQLLRASTAMRKAFGGQMTNRQLLDIAFGAAESSPSKAADLLSSAAEGGAHARAAGVTEQELLAGVAVNATVLDSKGGATRGGTSMRALMRALVRISGGETETYGKQRHERERLKKQLVSDEQAAEKQHRQWEETEREKTIRFAAVKHARPDREKFEIETARAKAAETERMAGLHAAFAARRQALPKTGGELTDEEGRPLGEDVKALQARLHLHGTLLERLHQIRAGGFNDAELQKLFGRQEGLLAYKNILDGEGDYASSLGRQGTAAREGLFGQILSMPAADPSLRAAAAARRTEEAAHESDQEAGTWENTYQAVTNAAYRQSGPGGKALIQIARPLDYLPFVERRKMQQFLRGGFLDWDRETRQLAVHALGGVQAAYGDIQSEPAQRYIRDTRGLILGGHFGENTSAMRQAIDDLGEAAKDLKQSAAELARSHRANPMIGHKDKGDRQ